MQQLKLYFHQKNTQMFSSTIPAAATVRLRKSEFLVTKVDKETRVVDSSISTQNAHGLGPHGNKLTRPACKRGLRRQNKHVFLQKNMRAFIARPCLCTRQHPNNLEPKQPNNAKCNMTIFWAAKPNLKLSPYCGNLWRVDLYGLVPNLPNQMSPPVSAVCPTWVHVLKIATLLPSWNSIKQEMFGVPAHEPKFGWKWNL